MNSFTQTSVPTKTKKRKERPSEGSELPVKRKKSKKDSVLVPSSPVASTSKGKARMITEQLQEEGASEFSVVSASVRVSIPPVFSADPRAGVEEMLDSMVMKHIPSLRGVVLSHSNLEFFDTTALIQNDCQYTICTVGFDATIWSPRVGMRLAGKVNLFSPDHISLLIHRTFNISIPRNHIPSDEYAFEYGPAEDDADWAERKEVEEVKPEPGRWVDPENTAEMVESMGRWTRRTTGEKVGREDGMVEFTVIGMTLANQMISLLGSLQPDPFNPAHDHKDDDVPVSAAQQGSTTAADDTDEESLPHIHELEVDPKKTKVAAPKEKKRKSKSTPEDGTTEPKKKKKRKTVPS